MALIRANRESIDDRFSVLGFTIQTDLPLFEVGLATHPELLKPENRARRTDSNFFTSRLLTATPPRPSRTGMREAVYLVPPNVVARFVSQPRLYFGLATYQEKDRSHPITVKIPDTGNMYVNLSGLTGRGLRRTARSNGASGYGNGGSVLAWGGDAIATPANGAAASVRNGNGNGNGNANGAASATPATPAPYSDGYSDDLWKGGSAGTPAADAAAPAIPATPASTNGAGEPPPAATSQAYATGQAWNRPVRTYAKPLLVEPYNQPSSWWDALITQLGHFARGAMWFLGVSDTTQPPFSAICQVRKPDGSAEGTQLGTAFFIGPRLLLTAAHVVDGETELIIVPGKNSAGMASANEPFGRFRVTQFSKHPSYGVNGEDNDMALICVPAANAASSPNYFGLVEELTQSRPEGVVVSGYAAWWHATTAIEEYVNKNIDKDRQHAHGGYIRELPTDGTFTYDLQTLAGTSGSPVYWIEGDTQPIAHLVGVHVAANDNRTNLGCRITPEKLAWIRGVATAWGQSVAFSLGVRSLSDEANDVGANRSDGDEAEAYSCNPEPVEPEFATEQSYHARTRAFTAPMPDYPGASRFVAAHTRNYGVGRRRGAVIDRIVIHITAGGPSINGTIGWFQDGERIDPKTGVQAGPSSAHYIVGRDGEVVQMVRNADTAYHASSANSRSIGIEHNANKPYRLNRRDLPPTQEQYQASAHLVAWLAAQYGVPLDREHIVGHIEATPSDNHDCPSSYWDWDLYMGCVRLAAEALAQNSSTGAMPATSQGLRNRTLTRAYNADPARFTWPAALAAGGHWVDIFAAEYNQRLDDGAYGSPAPDPSQFQSYEDADARARARTRRDIIDRLGRDLQSASDRGLIQRDLLALATAVAMQVLDLVAHNLPTAPYAPISTDPRDWPATPANSIVPGMLPATSRRIGMFLAWIDAAHQLATTDVTARVAAHRQEWEMLGGIIGAGGTLLGLAPGLGTGVTIVQMVVQAAMQAATPDFDRPQTDLATAMSSIRAAYRAFTGSLLRGLILARYLGADALISQMPLKPELESLIEEHAAHALRGWQDELRFLGVGLDTMAQSLGAQARTRNGTSVRAQELITPYYDPSNPASALTCTNDAFSQQREEWYVGVESTAAFPHSAICHLRMTAPDGRQYTGTGFYIGRTRILTCAHNLHGMSTVQIIPGRNGAGTTPFGEATIDSSQWRVAPRYTGDGDWDNDLAVIDNAPIEAPNGAFFRFMQATPGGTMPLAVCGYSSGSNLHRELNPVADRNKQHLHGGHAQGMQTADTIDYDILAIAGASGSPVYTVRDEGNGLEAFVCGVHVTRGPIETSGGPSVNRGCFITPTKIDWIEGRTTTFSYRANTTRTLSSDASVASEYPVHLIPQPDKNACWAASMAMLYSFRRNLSLTPETLASEVGASLATSYGWDLLTAVRNRYGFEMIEQPSNTSLYHSPQQWADWLATYGPLWVVIVGAPHAVVLAGIRGNLADPASVQVKLLNPWDTRVAFDNDAVAFNPPNNGYEDWLSFNQFASDFGNMAEANYGNWRVLHLPAVAANAQALGYNGRPLSRSRALDTDPSAAIGSPIPAENAEPIEPPRVAGTRMSVLRGSAGANRWALDRLEGLKVPGSANPPQTTSRDTVIELDDWPALDGADTPLPVKVVFNANNGKVGHVHIETGEPADVGYGVEVSARIEDSADVGDVAALRVIVDYRFVGQAPGGAAARTELRLLGDGGFERISRWLTAAQAA